MRTLTTTTPNPSTCQQIPPQVTAGLITRPVQMSSAIRAISTNTKLLKVSIPESATTPIPTQSEPPTTKRRPLPHTPLRSAGQTHKQIANAQTPRTERVATSRPLLLPTQGLTLSRNRGNTPSIRRAKRTSRPTHTRHNKTTKESISRRNNSRPTTTSLPPRPSRSAIRERRPLPMTVSLLKVPQSLINRE